MATSLQCEPIQRWRREDDEGGRGGRWHEGRRGRWASRALKAVSPLALRCALLPWPHLFFFLFLFFRFKTLGSLACLHAHLLPGGWLFCLRLRAGVGAAVESRHGAAFGVGVQAAVRRGIVGLELSWALHFLQSADCVDTKEQRTQIYWRNDWSEETLLIIILCFYKLDRNLIRMHSKH